MVGTVHLHHQDLRPEHYTFQITRMAQLLDFHPISRCSGALARLWSMAS